MSPQGKRSLTAAIVRVSRPEDVESNDDVAPVYQNEETLASEPTAETNLDLRK